MIETLSMTLIVIFCVLIFLAQVAGVASFVMLLLQSRKVVALQAEVVVLKNDLTTTKNELKTEIATLKTASDASKDDVIKGQFQIAELLNQTLKSNVDYLNKVAKEIVDSNFDAITKNTDDVLKLNTANSQKVFDAVVVMIQMMNGLMAALGYRPSAPAPDSGLQDPERGQNYGVPPAPNDQDGLTFARA